MKRDLPCVFAAITARLEDLHSLAIEGQSRDTSFDMYRVLAGELRNGTALIEGTLRDVMATIDRPSE